MPQFRNWVLANNKIKQMEAIWEAYVRKLYRFNRCKSDEGGF